MSVATLDVSLQLPAKLAVLMEPHRYKILYGGRGGGKSWSVARALLAHGMAARERILCTREIQRSIKDSVHRLLCDQIERLGLGAHYTITETEIRGANGTECIFAGLQDHTIDSIKSYEGVTKVWVEEAHRVSKRSWDILIPTIRRDGSEIWITFNAHLDTDETWLRFVVSPPPGAQVVEMSYRDNPWFSALLEAERQHARATMLSDDYDNIWEGRCRTAVSGAIYAREMLEAQREGRIGRVPYDPRMPVHTVWDLGWNDRTSIICVQRGLAELRIIKHLEFQYQRLDEMAAALQALQYNWGADWLPHDAYSRDLKTGRTVADLLTAFGRQPKPVNPRNPASPVGDVESGIRQVRQLFPRVWIDEGCTRLLECLRRYRRQVPKHGEPAEPVHDEFAHAADAMRYLAWVADRLRNEASRPTAPTLPPWRPVDAALGALG